MKWEKAIVLSILISGFSLTIGFAEMQAFIQSDTLSVNASTNYSSESIMELKKGDRVEVLGVTSPLLVSPFSQNGYISLDQVELFDITKSGEVILSKEVRVNSIKGVQIIPVGTSLPVYDYINNHYMIKWNGFYNFIHDTVVKEKLQGNIVKPVLVTEQVRSNLVVENNGLDDLFSDVGNTLTDYQKKKQEELESAMSSLIVDESTNSSSQNDNSDVKADFNFISGDFNIENYMHIPIVAAAVNEIDKPYVWGAIGPSSYDCSGFTYSLYKSLGITIPRVSQDQGSKGTLVETRDLKTGDLVFFDTRSVNNLEDITDDPNASSIIVEVDATHNPQDATNSVVTKFKPTTVTHVGMYIGDGYFIHASSGQKKVVIQNMNISYYQDRYLWAKRYM